MCKSTCIFVLSSKKKTNKWSRHSVITHFYSSTPTLQPAQSTTLASLYNSLELSWQANPASKSADIAITSAAPSSLSSSLSKSGYHYKQLTTESWYTKSVDKAIQTQVINYISALDSAEAKVYPTSTSKGGVPRVTGLGVAGVLGIVGGVLGAVL